MVDSLAREMNPSSLLPVEQAVESGVLKSSPSFQDYEPVLFEKICRIWQRTPRLVRNLTLVVLYIIFGVVIFMSGMTKEDDDGEEVDITFIDALYFTMVTISTVGYGDMSPIDHKPLRIFSIFYILVGICFVFSELACLFTTPLMILRTWVLAFLDKFDKNLKRDTNGDGVSDSYISGRVMGLSGKKIDLNNNGEADFVAPPNVFVFWAQELLPALILMMVVQLISAFCFVELEDIDYDLALYHCFITATTVGYGDVSISTQNGRLFASLHVLVSVAWLGALIGTVDDLRAVRKSQVARATLLTRMLDRDEVMSLNQNAEGFEKDGVDKLEFVVGMLMILGVELCGEPLTWEDVEPFIVKFKEMDVSDTNKITTNDLEHFVKQQKKNHPKAAKAKQQEKQKQQYRVGVLQKNKPRHTLKKKVKTLRNFQKVQQALIVPTDSSIENRTT